MYTGTRSLPRDAGCLGWDREGECTDGTCWRSQFLERIIAPGCVFNYKPACSTGPSFEDKVIDLFYRESGVQFSLLSLHCALEENLLRTVFS